MNKIVLSLVFAVGISIFLAAFNPEVAKIGTLIRENPFDVAMLIGLVVVIAMLKRHNTAP